MKIRHKWLATGTAIGIATLLWPGPTAGADTSLGGYTAEALSTVVHVEIFDPTIPIPATPQLEASLGYADSNVTTGPASRALASYLWPGPVIGDGFAQLTGNPASTYPIQVNSRFPATPDAPAKNTIQLTDGNGMTTASDGLTTSSTVTLVGLAGPGTNVTGGVGNGLQNLSPKTANLKVPAPPVDLPVSTTLAALMTAQNLTSKSTTVVADKTVTSTAHAAASDISLLNGIIKLSGVAADSQVVSDGAKATPTGDATISGLTIAGVKIPLSANGINLSLPTLTETVSSLLQTLGISISAVPATKTVDAASGEYHAKVLQISVDTKPLKAVLDTVISPLIAKIPPKSQTNLAPILNFGPKIVYTIGQTDSTANASPAFADDGSGSGGGDNGGGTAGTAGTLGTPGTSGTLGSGSLGSSTLPGGTGGAPGVGSAPTIAQASSLTLPPLGAVPRLLILGALVIAGIVGWLARRTAATIFGGARNCDYGLATGVPDLRKG